MPELFFNDVDQQNNSAVEGSLLNGGILLYVENISCLCYNKITRHIRPFGELCAYPKRIECKEIMISAKLNHKRKICHKNKS